VSKDRPDDKPMPKPTLTPMPAQFEISFGMNEMLPVNAVKKPVRKTAGAGVEELPPPLFEKPVAVPRAIEMKDHELASPVDRCDSLRWTSVTIGVATAVLLFANASTLSAWIDEKPPTALQLKASDAASGWNAVMDAIGITAPRRNLHEKWKAMQAARFGDEAPAVAQ